MRVDLIPDHHFVNAHPATRIFLCQPFRAIIAREFRLQAIQTVLETTAQSTIIPAFLQTPYWGSPSLIIGAGFDKTGDFPLPTDTSYAQCIGHLAQALGKTAIRTLEVRTTQTLPCLHDHADKLESSVQLAGGATAVWESLHKKTRSNIRRTLKQGFTHQLGATPTLLEAFYQLYWMNLHSLGSLPHPKTFFQDLLAHCANQILIGVAYLDGIPVAANWNFIDGETLYFAWAGRHTTHHRHDAFLTLLWQTLEYCAANGYTCYNLGRSSAGSSQHLFKQKLANCTEPIHYYRIPITAAKPTTSSVRNAAAWLIRRSPPPLMDLLSRQLIHHFY